MPRDPRPYTTYPVNYTTHPRWEGLSDAAFRTLHEMQDHSRIHGLDGLIPIPIARKKWRRRALDELVAGAPGTDRPLVVLRDDGYFIRSYEEHQFTTGDAADLRKKRSEAGSMGGKAKANARPGTSKRVASASREPWQNVAESKSESELEIQTDMTHLRSVSPEGDVLAPGTDPNLVSLINERTERAAIAASRLGIPDLPKVRELLEHTVAAEMTLGGAVELAGVLLGKAKGEVRDPTAYLITVCDKTPATVQDAYDQLDIGAVA